MTDPKLPKMMFPKIVTRKIAIQPLSAEPPVDMVTLTKVIDGKTCTRQCNRPDLPYFLARGFTVLELTPVAPDPIAPAAVVEEIPNPPDEVSGDLDPEPAKRPRGRPRKDVAL